MLKEKDYVYIQSYKHDGSLHRTWIKGFVIEVRTDRRRNRSCLCSGKRWPQMDHPRTGNLLFLSESVV